MDLPDRDDVLRRAAANCAGAYLSLARAMGMPWQRWDDLCAADLGLPVPTPPNSATLLSPMDEARLDDVVSRVEEFFGRGVGGGYEIWSIWPTPDLGARGYEPFTSPAMTLPVGADPRPVPPELRIVEVDDRDGVRDAEALWIEGFEIDGAEPGRVADERALDAWRIWVGYVNGRPVSSSAAYVSDGFVGVYAVATARDARGRGYGEALTWAAVLAEPSLPATLQASPMGLPVYERMGYRTIAEFTVWEHAER